MLNQMLNIGSGSMIRNTIDGSKIVRLINMYKFRTLIKDQLKPNKLTKTGFPF